MAVRTTFPFRMITKLSIYRRALQAQPLLTSPPRTRRNGSDRLSSVLRRPYRKHAGRLWLTESSCFFPVSRLTTLLHTTVRFHTILKLSRQGGVLHLRQLFRCLLSCNESKSCKIKSLWQWSLSSSVLEPAVGALPPFLTASQECSWASLLPFEQLGTSPSPTLAYILSFVASYCMLCFCRRTKRHPILWWCWI